MKDILDMNINELAGVEFDCPCGKHHRLNVEHIAIGPGVLGKVVEFGEKFKAGKVLMISDDNTFEVAGEKTLKLLEENGFNVKSFVFHTGKAMLIPNEKAVGRAFMEMEPGTGLIVSVGSGVLSDLAKVLSAQAKIPYIMVCTAPSMDGYATGDSPLICEGHKISYHSTLAYAIVGDTEIMKKAPMRMIWAGFGDVIGKLTALSEWKMSRDLTGEYYCETVAKLVEKALAKTIENAEAIGKRDEKAIGYLVEALTLTGAAMGLIGVSRPCSGSEHLLSHFWEMYFIEHKMFAEFHGIKVGLSTPVISDIFYRLRGMIPESAFEGLPTREEIEALLKKAGAPVYPTEIGISRDLFKAALLGAWDIRKRYNILQFAMENGLLEKIAEEEAERIYGK